MLSYIKAISSNAFRTSFMQGYKIYWDALYALIKLKFYISHKMFSFGEWSKKFLQSYYIFWLLFRRAFWGIASAILLVCLLSFVERYASFEQLPEQKSELVNTYGILAQISGLILGLYFTAMSVVISTVYSKVPDNIRNLIAKEKVGDNYIKILMLLGTMSLVELGAILQGFPPSRIVLYFALFLSLMALLTLPVLVHNIFHFFDPARLAETYIFPEAIGWARKATCEFQGWNNPSFQNHYYIQANQSLSTYENIVNLLVQDPTPNNASLTRLMAIELSFLSFYTTIKSQIPAESRWYQYQIEHPKWFESNSTSAEIAINANISLPHKITANPLWVEERVANNLEVILSHLLKDNDLEQVIELIQHLQKNIILLVKSFALKEAYLLTEVFDNLIVKYLSEVTVSDKNKINLIALADFFGANYVIISIEYGKILEEISPDNLRKNLQPINWKKSLSAYKSRLPISILPSVEDIMQKKQNQFIVDDSIKIPEWYDLELIAIACLRFLHTTVEDVVSQYEKVFTDKIKIIKEDKAPFLLLQILTRGLEGYSKCSTFLYMSQKLDKDLQGLVCVKDIPHPTLEWDGYNKRVENIRSKVVERFGALASTINPQDIDKTVPDYAGHAYWLLARESFLALCEQDEERYKKAYSIYILLMNQTWSYFSSILAKGQNVEYYMSTFSEIFIDAMAIGGYAKLFNEFREGNYWKTTTDVWDGYLAAINKTSRESKDILTAFLTTADYKGSSWSGITSRSLERTGWQQEYNYIVRRETGLSDDDYYRRGYSDRNTLDHIGSALLRTVATTCFHNPESVFIYSYILQKPEMKDAKVDRRTEQFIRSLEAERRNEQDADNT